MKRYLALGALVAVYALAVGLIVLLVVTVIAAIADDPVRRPLQVAAAIVVVLAGGLVGVRIAIRTGVVAFEK